MESKPTIRTEDLAEGAAKVTGFPAEFPRSEAAKYLMLAQAVAARRSAALESPIVSERDKHVAEGHLRVLGAVVEGLAAIVAEDQSQAIVQAAESFLQGGDPDSPR